MSLVREDKILKMAEEANTAAIAFICIDYNMVSAVTRAAEACNKPAIIMLLPEHVTHNHVSDFKSFAAMVEEAASRSRAVLALHLDHSYDEQEVYRAIDAGFTSVMFDVSKEDLETNIKRVRQVAAYAHDKGVVVEAELGAIGVAKDSTADRTDYYTKPEIVEYFIQETQVDSLAISIGNAHGDYPFPPELDLKRLNEINKITDVPLVLHGGSGIPDVQLKKAFSSGINKFNYGTDVLRCYDSAIREYHTMHQPPASLDILDMPEFVQNKMSTFIEKKMSLCRFDF